MANQENNYKNLFVEEKISEISFSDILNTLLRFKKLIITVTSIFTLISIIYALSARRVWKGQFQIVISNDNSKSSAGLLSELPSLSSFAGLGNSSNKLKTEVETLRSPSLLMPIFRYVAEKKNKKGEEILDFNFRFFKWMEDDIKINLKKGTSIVNISYFDKDKELILPVLTKISNAYQKYSKRDKVNSLKKGINYLNNQVVEFKKKSLASLEIAQKYAIENDLTTLNVFPISNNIQKPNLFQGENRSFNQSSNLIDSQSAMLNSFETEEKRIAATNKIKKIDLQIKQIKSLDDNDQIIEFLRILNSQESSMNYLSDADNDNVMNNRSLLITYNNLNNEIINKRKIFRDSDPILKEVVDKKNYLISAIKKQIIYSLESSKQLQQVILDANTRPKETLVKYRELLREYLKDENTLNNLEKQQRLLMLQESFSQDPWELITKPILLEYPVAPSRRVIVIFGTILGLFSGSLYALYSDKKKDTLYNLNEFQKRIDSPLLEQLLVKDKDNWTESLKLLVENKISGNENITLVSIGDIDNNLIKEITDKLNLFMPKAKVTFSSDFSKVAISSNRILITAAGITSRSALDNLKYKLNNQKDKIIGWILLNYETNYL